MSATSFPRRRRLVLLKIGRELDELVEKRVLTSSDGAWYGYPSRRGGRWSTEDGNVDRVRRAAGSLQQMVVWAMESDYYVDFLYMREPVTDYLVRSRFVKSHSLSGAVCGAALRSRGVFGEYATYWGDEPDPEFVEDEEALERRAARRHLI